MLSIRGAIALVVGVAALLLGGSMYVASVRLEAADDRTAAEGERSRSVALAESLRTSSNDLTRMVRLYAATGDDRYRVIFERILAIRAGTAPRPRDYDQSFWDRVLDRGEAGVRLGPARSLEALMRDEGFRPDELRALQRALGTSNRLARTESEVIAAIQGANLRPSDPRAPAVLFPQFQRLADPAYHREKGRIMAAIDQFVALVTRRADARLARLRDRERSLGEVQLGLLGLVGLLGAAAFTFGRVALSAPLLRLRDGMRELVAAREPGSTQYGPLRELREAGAAFEALVSAWRSDRRRPDPEPEEEADAVPAAAVLAPTAQGVDVRLLVEHAVAERGGAVRAEVDEDVPALFRGDPDALARVLDSLLDDALATYGETTLLVSARRLYEDRYEVRLTVGSGTYAFAAPSLTAASVV